MNRSDRYKTPLHQIDEILKDMTFAEFFAGIGLMRAGLEQKGWKAAFANDIDPDKYKMYSANFAESGSHFLLDDIHNLKASSPFSVR